MRCFFIAAGIYLSYDHGLYNFIMSIPRLLTYSIRADLLHLYYNISFLIACRYIMIIDHGVFRVLYYEQSTILLQETKIMRIKLPMF